MGAGWATNGRQAGGKGREVGRGCIDISASYVFWRRKRRERGWGGEPRVALCKIRRKSQSKPASRRFCHWLNRTRPNANATRSSPQQMTTTGFAPKVIATLANTRPSGIAARRPGFEQHSGVEIGQGDGRQFVDADRIGLGEGLQAFMFVVGQPDAQSGNGNISERRLGESHIRDFAGMSENYVLRNLKSGERQKRAAICITAYENWSVSCGQVHRQSP